MKISTQGLELIKRFESFRADWYQCSARVWTIGYGHAEHAAEGRPADKVLVAGYTAPLTEEEAEDLLRLDLARYETTVEGVVETEISHHQFDALVSLTYNIGVGAFRRSTLLERLNEGDHEAVAKELLKWKYVDGSVSEGLLRRRKAELALYQEETERSFEIEPEPLDPMPVRPVETNTNLDDPRNYPIRTTPAVD